MISAAASLARFARNIPSAKVLSPITMRYLRRAYGGLGLVASPSSGRSAQTDARSGTVAGAVGAVVSIGAASGSGWYCQVVTVSPL